MCPTLYTLECTNCATGYTYINNLNLSMRTLAQQPTCGSAYKCNEQQKVPT
jgi:hypothetical protein